MTTAQLLEREPSLVECAFATIVESFAGLEVDGAAVARGSVVRGADGFVVELAGEDDALVTTAVASDEGTDDRPAVPRRASIRAMAAAPAARPAVTARIAETAAAGVTEAAAPTANDESRPLATGSYDPTDAAALASHDDRGPSATGSFGPVRAAALTSHDESRADATGSSGAIGVAGHGGAAEQAESVFVAAQDEAVPGACDAVDRLSGVLGTVSELAGTSWHELGGRRVHEALDLVEQLDRRLTGLRAAVLAVVEAEGLWALDGQRTFTAWLKQRTDTTPGSASKQVRHARALRDHLPLTRAALDAGEVSGEHVSILVREALHTERLRAQLTDPDLGEAFLVAQAREMDAGTFAKLVKHWAITADPEAADRAWREAGTKEELTLARTLDGYHLAGWLDEVSGQALDTALRSHMGRKDKGDERTAAQRRAAALVSLARQSLDAGLQGAHARIRPHLTVTTSWETLQALAAATGSVVPPSRSDGTAHQPGASFGFWADSTLTAPGGPRDPHRADDADEGAAPFDLPDEARQWLQQWEPGDVHVISTAIDPTAMTGIAPATLEDGTPIPPALLARLACESGLSRVVFGPDSTVLDVGREQRIYPAHMVRAIHARDRHCQYPGCDEPPGFGEIHHSLQWYRDHGPTHVDTGILLCWHHHDWVHAHKITIVRAHGHWYFYDRNGWHLTPPGTDNEPPPHD